MCLLLFFHVFLIFLYFISFFNTTGGYHNKNIVAKRDNRPICMKKCDPRRGEDYYPLGFSDKASPADHLPRFFRNFQHKQMRTARFRLFSSGAPEAASPGQVPVPDEFTERSVTVS